MDTLDVFSFNGLSLGNIYDVYIHLSPGRINNAKVVDWSNFVCRPGYVPIQEYIVNKKVKVVKIGLLPMEAILFPDF